MHARVTRLASGKYLVAGQLGAGFGFRPPLLFRQDGTFERLAVRAGRGPGELTIGYPVIAGRGDSVWIFEGPSRHLFSPELEFARRQEFVTATDAIQLRADRWVVAATISSPTSEGQPLHITDDRGFPLRSFGLTSTAMDPRMLAANGDNADWNRMRELTPDTDSTFWTTNPTRFLLERYDSNGSLLMQARRELGGWYAAASRRNPGSGEFKGLALAQAHRSGDRSKLWLIYHERNASYSEPTSAASFTLTRWARMHDVVVEALDISTMRIVAILRFPASFAVKVNNAPDYLQFVRDIGDDMHAFTLVKLSIGSQ